MTRTPHTRRLRGGLGIAVTLGLTAILGASTPGSGTINTPSDDTLGTKQTLTFTAGPFVAGSLAGTQVRDTVAVCTQRALTPPAVCDSYAVHLNLPTDYWHTRRGDLTASIKWADAPDGNDLDLYIVDENNRILTSSTTDNTAAASETAVLVNPGVGPRTYRVIVVNWLTVSPIETVAGTVTFNLVTRDRQTLPHEPTPPAHAPRFHNFYPPSGLGDSAGEPTIGINHTSGAVMFVAWLETLQATFDDRTSPATAAWANRSFLSTSLRSNDPILFTDPATGRTFVSQLIFPSKQSLSAFTKDDGDTWEISQGSGINSGVDHQTIGGGRFAAGIGSIAVDGYPNAVYYAAQDIATAEFALSADGGRSTDRRSPCTRSTSAAVSTGTSRCRRKTARSTCPSATAGRS